MDGDDVVDEEEEEEKEEGCKVERVEERWSGVECGGGARLKVRCGSSMGGVRRWRGSRVEEEEGGGEGGGGWKAGMRWREKKVGNEVEKGGGERQGGGWVRKWRRREGGGAKR